MDRLPGLPPTAALAPLYGRESDLRQLLTLLHRGVRLLTLRGPGGIGKTALMLHLAHALHDQTKLALFDHVQFIDLSALRDPERVLGHIAAALPESGFTGTAAQRLQEFAARQRTLLLLDNFEQLLPAAAELADLLTASPLLHLVVTSRAILQLHDEVEYPVEPLALPHSLRDAMSSPAVQLFVARVQALTPSFALNDGNAVQITQLCEVLEGVPLALELAAVRTRSYVLGDLLARLAHPLQVLKADFRDRPERLRSLRAAVQWSYDLLDDTDRAVFECCAVFEGPFSPQALAAVWGEPDVLDRAESLLSQSFLHRLDTPETLWKMLQPLRELALEHLEGHPEAVVWRERHARYFLERLEQHHFGWEDVNVNTDDRPAYLIHYPNIRAGMVWTVAQSEADLAYRYLGTIGTLWAPFGLTVQETPLVDRVLGLPRPADGPVLIRALQVSAFCLNHSGRFSEQEVCLREALALCEEVADFESAAWVQLNLAGLEHDAGRSAQALELQETQLREYLTRLGDRRPSRMQRMFHANARLSMALSLLGLGDYPRALELAQEAQWRFQAAGNAMFEIESRVFVGLALLHLHRPSEAGPKLLSCLQDAADQGFRGMVEDSLRWGLVFLAADLHDWQSVTQFVAFMGDLTDEQSRSLLDRRVRDFLAQARETLGEASFQKAWASGERLQLPAIIERAQALIQEARPVSSPALFELTPREREVLALVSQGHPDRRVARLLGISPGTASKHVGNLLGKLGLHNRVELTRWAIEQNRVEGSQGRQDSSGQR
ncbi:LuxR C-terminal-related transcriptional regulator [Deinococcus sp. QL22]|uniref:ATP-binding protein n=1 Tax=Deinococcus sp. QL22 TaxID=2939437 RepID=UPI00201827B1|nr:LuxR C-terminal-related transcriptional regulator [Deinococcus sp. QL22]UQN08300.1 LuxR C-terminal-related transcriptional regulator [Deinococcus sp. QL22]